MVANRKGSGIMPKLTGIFEVKLRTPIYVSFDFDVSRVSELDLEVHGNNILIRPLEPRPHIQDKAGDIVEPPVLERISIWITKNVPRVVVPTPKQWPAEERKRFEPIIIEAARRFVKAIAARTGNWELDYRQPVYSYTSRYILQDENLPAESLQNNAWLIPKESAEGLIIWHGDEFIGDLTEDIWKKMAADIQKPVGLNHYDEAIFDAMRFRRQLRYDTALLYAAFAAETILKEISIALLGRRGLTLEQIDVLLDHARMPSLIQLIRTFPEVALPKFGNHKLENLFEIRNAIAHKKKTSATASEASSAIRVARELKDIL
jgi:hypothetical protein